MFIDQDDIETRWTRVAERNRIRANMGRTNRRLRRKETHR